MKRTQISSETPFEIPCPYCNWDLLPELFKAETTTELLSNIFYACHGVSSQGAAEMLEATPLITFKDARKLATVLFSWVADHKLEKRLVEVTDLTGIDVTYLSKYRVSGKTPNPYSIKTLESGEKKLIVNDSIRPFSLPFALFPGFCAVVMHQTCNELMFGEKRPVILPRIYRDIAGNIPLLSKSSITELISFGKTLRDEAIKRHEQEGNSIDNNEGIARFGQYRPEHVIVKERLEELRHDLNTLENGKYVFFSERQGPRRFKLSWNASTRNGQTDSEGNLNETQYLPNLEMAMFWTLATIFSPELDDKSLDYFIVNDYIQVLDGATPEPTRSLRTKILTYNKEGRVEEICDEDILRILSFCIALPDNLKSNFLGKTLSCIY